MCRGYSANSEKKKIYIITVVIIILLVSLRDLSLRVLNTGARESEK